jgi:hypothetical protein
MIAARRRVSSSARDLSLRALVLLLFVSWNVSAFGQTDEDVAAQHYPPALDDFFIHTHAAGTPVVRETALLRLDLTGSGVENELAVVYSNGLAGELFLFRGAGTGAVLLDRADDSPVGRGSPRLEAIDIENDGIPELEVRFMRETWLYRFNGSALVQISPPSADGNENSAGLGSVAYFDVDGDGTLEVLEADGLASEAAYVVHELQGARFLRTATEVAFFDEFLHIEGQGTSERTFEAAPGNYSLQVVLVAPPPEDGGGGGIGEVTLPPEVTLNGTVVYGGDGPAMLGDQDGGSIPVSLGSQNALSVELPTNPDHATWILITRRGASQ